MREEAPPDSGRPHSRLIWELVRLRLPLFTLATTAGLVGSAARLGTPLATKSILDSVGGRSGVITPIVILVALVIVGSFAQWWQLVTLGNMAEGVVYDVRRRMNARLLYARLPSLQRRPVGELVARVMMDSVLLRQAASSSIVGGVNATVMLVGGLVMMAILDLQLAAVTVVAMLILSVVFGRILPSIARSQELAQQEVSKLGGELDSNLRAIKSIKVAVAEERVRSRLDEVAASSRDVSLRAVRRQALAVTTSAAGVQGVILVLLAVGALRVTDGAMTVSALVAFLLYAFQIGDPISQMSESLTALQVGLAAARRIRHVDDMPSEKDHSFDDEDDVAGDAIASAVGDATPAIAPPDMPPLVQLRNVHAGYPDAAHQVLAGIDMGMPGSGHVALIGPSGAGKTTLFSLLLRFLEPSSGELLLGERAYQELPLWQTRAQFAYVEQESPLVPGTVRDNLCLINTQATEEAMFEVLERLSLRRVIETLPQGLDSEISSTSLSGGERQRIAVARALLSERPVLLLDEATAQVDALTENAIHEAIVDHSRTGLVITIAHRLSTVVDADLIIVLREGQVIAQGTHEELVATSPLYRELLAALRIPTAVPEPGER
ncbi:ABC transporter ATP-binding protein [Gordonia bronchialis]|uniref:ABC transporter ATP-binding protein n=1 Tax=Gordonia bronchialis TaxID=2054 RepID=UPI00226EEDD5|nr:ABC transporter ATP-binding protein [Gordonia bronchialis]